MSGISRWKNLDEQLEGVQRIAIDTPPFIYLVERHPRYLDVVRECFRRVNEGSLAALTSTITLTEVWTLPIRLGRNNLVSHYLSLLRESRHLALCAIDEPIAIRAAEPRARYGLRTPDTLQIATALVHHCDAFLTNDARLKRVDAICIVVLDDLAED